MEYSLQILYNKHREICWYLTGNMSPKDRSNLESKKNDIRKAISTILNEMDIEDYNFNINNK